MLQQLLNALQKKGFDIYINPFHLNIVGVRNSHTVSNAFNDTIHVFFQNPLKQWIHHVFKATTLPGVYWLHNPLNKNGTAILMDGQYKDSHQIGLHKGKYSALIQKSPVKVLHDNDRDAFGNVQLTDAETGLFGINIHRADAENTSLKIGKYSAGCQVIANPKEFDLFMQLANTHKNLHGNSFTYTLLSQEGLQ
jgi:hypothetical protein